MLTNPSHASILTSLYPRDHGVYSNQSGISDDLRTLPRELRKAGFRAGAVVAFPHLNGNVANFARGFDRFVPGTREERRASEQVELALKTVDALAADRLFLWLHISDPHAPYEPEGAVREVQPPTTPTQQAAAKAPGFQRNNPWFKSAFRRFAHTEVFYDRYVAEVEAVDRALVELREALQAKGIWDEALVVLTSDHGENFGEHDLWFHHGGLYDPTVHVPLIVRGPRIPRRVDSAPIEHVDIAPTVLDALGMPRWEPMRGDSVLSSSDGQRYAFSEHMMAQAVSVRDDEWLAILHRRNTGQFPSYPLKSGERELWRRNPSGDLLRVERGDYPVAAARLDSAIDEYLGAG
ncbi:MAG: sulfatase, partial [Myxococcota bacterium]